MMVINQVKNEQESYGASELVNSARIAQKWVTEKALPFWAANAQAKDGGFCEELNLDKSANWQSVRRLRVQARQIYTYTLACDLDWYPDPLVAENTVDFMLKNGFMPDGAPGFIHLLNPDLSVNDARRDLYDHAFYLLALAWHGRTTGAQNSLAKAKSIVEYLNTYMKDEYGGWSEGYPINAKRNYPRRQNPHMHLLEAYMALFDATGDAIYLDNANLIYNLFTKHFFDENDGSVTEYFHKDWTPLSGEQGQSIEPGHAAEWVWLLGQYEGRTGINTRKYADALYGRLLKSTKPYLNDEETKDGRILRGTKRLWVQTEWVKAHLSQFEFGNLESAGLAVDTVKHIFDNYLNTDGSWCDRLSEQNTRVNAAIPTSTFYHILCMTAELCRVSGLNENQKTKRRAHVRS